MNVSSCIEESVILSASATFNLLLLLLRRNNGHCTTERRQQKQEQQQNKRGSCFSNYWQHRYRDRSSMSYVVVWISLLLVFVSSNCCCTTAFQPLPPTLTLITRAQQQQQQQQRYICTNSLLLHCQLLGINCASNETEFELTWPTFCERGGITDIHSDGWGLAYYEGNRGLRQFHDVEAASTSPLAQFLGKQKIQTNNLLAHIRYATAGAVDLANVHPFAREMWAVNWCFCHNGEVPLFQDKPDYCLGNNNENGLCERFYYPVGDTDSEATFCAILNALRTEFSDTMPSLPVLYDRIQSLCKEIVNYNPSGTILNFLLTCGPHVLWVYSWPGQRPGSKVWNGLYYLIKSKNTNLHDEDMTVQVKSASEFDDVCIVATKPISNDNEWIELQPGELIVMDGGIPHITSKELFKIELQGHGLNNNGKVLNPPHLEEDMRRYQFQPDFYVGGGI